MKYFNEKEENLTCPCGCGAELAQSTKDKLDALREAYGKAIYPEQGATCESYSVNHVHRKPTSTHIDRGTGGKAVDIKSKTFESKRDFFRFIGIAQQLGFNGFGIGSYWVGNGNDHRLHIDTKFGTNKDLRTWEYK